LYSDYKEAIYMCFEHRQKSKSDLNTINYEHLVLSSQKKI